MQSSADNLLRELRALGVKRIHVADGETMAHITNAAAQTTESTQLLLSHSGWAAPAAAGEAAVSGQLAVCVGSIEDDSFLDGVANSIRTDAAVLAILLLPAQNANVALTGRLQALADGGARCEVVDNGSSLRNVIAQAVRIANDERSVAVLAISICQPAPLGGADPLELVPRMGMSATARRVPHADDVSRAALALGVAQNVVLVAGGGTADAHDEVLALACTLQAPIAHTLRGKENLEWGNPYDVGLAGDSGHSSSREAMARADAVVLLGTDFAYPHLIPPSATVVQIDRDARRIGRRTPVHFALVGDVGETLVALSAQLSLRTDKTFMVEATARRRMEDDWLRSEAVTAAFDAENVAALLSDVASADAVFAVDVGPEWHRAIRHLRTNGSRRLIGSMRHGSLADAVARAAGAQSGDAERQVIALVGLRGAARLGEQLTALAAHDLPVKTVLLNPCPAATWLSDGLSDIDVTRLNLFSDVRPALTRLLASRGTAAVEIALGIPTTEHIRQQLSGARR